MAQQGHRFGGREAADNCADDEREECARDGLRERTAGAVIDADTPGFKADRNTSCQETVGRDERRRLPWRFDGFPQDEGDDFRFILRGRRFDE